MAPATKVIWPQCSRWQAAEKTCLRLRAYLVLETWQVTVGSPGACAGPDTSCQSSCLRSSLAQFLQL